MERRYKMTSEFESDSNGVTRKRLDVRDDVARSTARAGRFIFIGPTKRYRDPGRHKPP